MYVRENSKPNLFLTRLILNYFKFVLSTIGRRIVYLKLLEYQEKKFQSREGFRITLFSADLSH